MENINQTTFDRYLLTAPLDADTKKAMRKEFLSSKNPSEVYNKLIRMSGNKAMTKVPSISHK